MKNYFGFIDETGVLHKDPIQRFFGLGFLKLENTAPYFELLHKELGKAKQKINNKFEFKFNRISRPYYTLYSDLVDLYFKCKENYFCVFIIDKEDPNIDIDKYFKSTWDAHISYTMELVKNNMDENDKIFILADYLSKPKCSLRHYEIEVKSLLKNSKNIVANCCMLESNSSLYIQIVDVLLGAVAYDFKCERINGFSGTVSKKGIVNLIRGKLKVPKLSTNLTAHKPNYFSVWEFSP